MNLKKIVICASVLALAGASAVSAATATAEEKAAKKAAVLEKYDANKDGKINRDERAVKKADDEAERARKKAEREAKRAAKKDKGANAADNP